jgi:hypothetical protein
MIMLPSNAPSVSIFEAMTILPSAAPAAAGKSAKTAPNKNPRTFGRNVFPLGHAILSDERVRVEHELRPLKLLAKFTGTAEKFETRHDNVFVIRNLWSKPDTVLTVRQRKFDVRMTPAADRLC